MRWRPVAPRVHEHVRYIHPYACTCAVQPRPYTDLGMYYCISLHIHMQASAPAPPPRLTSRSLPSIRDIHTTNSYMYNADERVFFCATHHLFSALALPLRAEVFSCDRQLCLALKMCGTMHYSDIRSFCLQIAAMIICIYLLMRCCPVFPF